MKNISITTFINLLFVFTFISVTAGFVFFVEWDKERYDQYHKQRYTIIANTFISELQRQPTKKHIEQLLSSFEIKPVKSRTQKVDILKNAKLIFVQESYFGRTRIFFHKNSYYLYIQNYGYNLMLKDISSKDYYSKLALILFALINIILIILYVNLTRKLIPLSRLNGQIEEFANGNLKVKIDDYAEDEIGKIANSFRKSIKYINDLIASKNLFMRNMMHELKTPITKGRIIAESVEDEDDKAILIRAFERMNDIISNLAQIEKITLLTQKIEKNPIKLSSIIQNSKNILLHTKDDLLIEEQYKDITIDVDENLFTIVLKNLIDNGIKFSQNQKVTIKATSLNITVISKGEKLNKPLKDYIEPFTQEEKRQSGFGLGLYIVKSILNIHEFGFHYEHEDGNNKFIIELENSCPL